MKPSVGRIVHYVSYGTPGGEYPSVCRAAVITEVQSDTNISLCVLNPTGQFFNTHVSYSEENTDNVTTFRPGTWHWPERVEE